MSLAPPHIETVDPGAHELEESSDDHFSSASEGSPSHQNPHRLSTPQSPIPVTRVERVDDVPAHGEVPGTQAYDMRTQDAVPDELEIVPEGQRSRSGTRSRAMSNLSTSSRPDTPGGSPIPKTVVERVDDKPAHGEVEGTLAKEMRAADAEPDEMKVVPEKEGRAIDDGQDGEVSEEQRQAWFKSMWEGKQEDTQQEPQVEDVPETEQDVNEDDDFGDDFDDFAEEGGDDDDFGDFDEAEEATVSEEVPQQTAPQPAAVPDSLAGLPPLDLASKSRSDLQASILPYLDAIFPPTPPTTPPTEKEEETISPSPFLTDRSLSLWQQLASPPPMAPPNWTRSRIRRLFLVSLGVPVDLDEILPPSKQRKLTLPNINLSTSPDQHTQVNSAVDRLKENAMNDSSTSVDSKGAPKPKSKTRQSMARQGPPPPPEFDLNAAALLCGTTPEAMWGFEDQELKNHAKTLEVLNRKASAVLEYWLMRRDDGLKEKEALEGVIENLVGFVKGRKGR